jgi:hypothetical protein
VRPLGLTLAAVLLASAAVAEPEPAPGWRLEAVPAGLASPAGALAADDGLFLTDLASGRIVRIGEDGEAETLWRLPAGVDVLGEPTGPYSLAVADGRLFATTGWPDAARTALPTDHALVELLPDGGVEVIADGFWNPYDLARHGDRWLVTDAGRNALLAVGADGTLAEVAAFAPIEVPRSSLARLSPTEFAEGPPLLLDAVPTGIAVLADRAYIALFGGFPFPEGSGSVVSVPLDGSGGPRVEVAGLDAPSDLAAAGPARLAVLEMGRFDITSGTFATDTGRASLVDLATGQRLPLVAGLSRSAGIAAAGPDAFVVTELGGAVWRIVREDPG